MSDPANIDWTKSMIQTFEYCKVDPETFGDESNIDSILSCTITRDSSKASLGSATIDATEALDEQYVRVYLKIIQNKIEYRVPLGTFLVESPSVSFDGMVSTISMDGYTSLIELKENIVPVGYALMKGNDILSTAYQLVRNNCRAGDRLIQPTEAKTLKSHFVADTNDTWLSFISALLRNADYELDLEPDGTPVFKPIVARDALQPVWTYNDDNSSILQPDISTDRDLYGIPNVVEVILSYSNQYKVITVENRESGSPTSIEARGRRIVHRVYNPSGIIGATNKKYKAEDDAIIREYAKNLLISLSTIEYSVSYSHGYCPVRVGDAVILNYKAAGFYNVKAVVTAQQITCKTGCVVSETAVYSEVLYDGREVLDE